MNIKKLNKYLQKNNKKLSDKKKKILLKLIKLNKNIKWKVYRLTLHREIKGQARPRSGRGGRIYDPDGKYKKILGEDLVNELCENYKIPHKIKEIMRFIKLKDSKKKKKGIKVLKRTIDPDYIFKNQIKIYINHYRKPPYNTNEINKYLMNLKVIRPQTTPDLDNIEKIILDSLNENIIKDDMNVCTLHMECYYSDNPKCELIIKHKKEPYIMYHRGIENEI
jgi:Holliday junction resolvase RusA-like endonuclease